MRIRTRAFETDPAQSRQEHRGRAYCWMISSGSRSKADGCLWSRLSSSGLLTTMGFFSMEGRLPSTTSAWASVVAMLDGRPKEDAMNSWLSTAVSWSDVVARHRDLVFCVSCYKIGAQGAHGMQRRQEDRSFGAVWVGAAVRADQWCDNRNRTVRTVRTADGRADGTAPCDNWDQAQQRGESADAWMVLGGADCWELHLSQLPGAPTQAL